tara:strand:- start:142 stop:480 length:339 start_codon:yes stop_codon:yes gene_type:complete
MDSRHRYTEVNASSYSGYVYTFDSDFVLELMRLDLYTSVPIVIQIEKYVDENYNDTPDDRFELAGVVRRKKPYYFVVELSHYDDMIFENLHNIDSDTFLDYYNKNMLLSSKT